MKSWIDKFMDLFGTAGGQMLVQDVDYALRLIRKSPGFSAIVIITLALGVGANTAIFSVVRGLMLKPLPYKDSAEIVVVRQELQKKNINDMLFSAPEINDYRKQTSTLSSLVEYHSMRFTLLEHGVARRVRTGVVSSNYFDLFAVKPILGRSFQSQDEHPGAAPVVLLSYEFWRESDMGDSHIVGKTFVMNDKIHTVIGVLPPVPQYPNDNDVYMTTSACPFRSAPSFASGRNKHLMNVFARRKSDVTPGQVNADLGVVSSRLQQQYPEIYKSSAGYRAVSFPLAEELTNRARPIVWVLFYAAAFVLLIASANVTNLTLARLARREPELALRTALGADRRRLLRQLLTESAVLGLLATVVGVAFAAFSEKLLVQFVSRLTPRARDISIDPWVLLFALGTALLTSVLSGCSTVLFSKGSMQASLKDGTRGSTIGTGRQRIRDLLVTAQVAFSFALLIGAGLMLQSFVKLQNVDPGFAGERVLSMAIDLNWSRYVTDAQLRVASRSILDRVQSLPGVSSVAVSSSFPLDPDALQVGSGALSREFLVRGKLLPAGEVAPRSTIRSASPSYFKTLGIALIRGRVFLASDLDHAPAIAIVNQAFARHRFGAEDPIGQRISRDGGASWATVIGVVGNTREFDLSKTPEDEVYYPLEQVPDVASLLVLTRVEPMALAEQIRKAIHEFDPETVIANMQTLEAAREDTLSSPRVMTSLLGIFATLALIVSAAGIGGMLALSVSQRIKEIGVRMALGAQRSEVVGLVIKRGMLLVLLGLGVGAVFALGIAASLRSLLFQVGPTDPFTFVGAGVTLGLVGFGACYIPAFRAARINPVITLRQD